MFFVDLKPVPNNKDAFNVEYIQQCKIKFKPPKHKRDNAQCANSKRYGHTKNYCHLKPKCVNVQVAICQGSVTIRKDLVMSNVSYVLETIPQLIRNVLSTKSYRKKHTHRFE
jgi:hypothetical protein